MPLGLAKPDQLGYVKGRENVERLWCRLRHHGDSGTVRTVSPDGVRGKEVNGIL